MQVWRKHDLSEWQQTSTSNKHRLFQESLSMSQRLTQLMFSPGQVAKVGCHRPLTIQAGFASENIVGSAPLRVEYASKVGTFRVQSCPIKAAEKQKVVSGLRSATTSTLVRTSPQAHARTCGKSSPNMIWSDDLWTSSRTPSLCPASFNRRRHGTKKTACLSRQIRCPWCLCCLNVQK